MKQDLLKIINHYGVLKQLKYFQSEIFELNEAIISYENAKDSNNIHHCDIEYALESFEQNIAEEIADVQVMLDQFQHYYEIEDKEIEEIMKYKINRQLERIGGDDLSNCGYVVKIKGY